MRISSLTLGQVSTNCYFIESDQHTLIVDPAGDSDLIFKKLNQICNVYFIILFQVSLPVISGFRISSTTVPFVHFPGYMCTTIIPACILY